MAHCSNGLIPRLDGKQATSLDVQSGLMLQIRMKKQNFAQIGKEKSKANEIRPKCSVIHDISFCLGPIASKY